MASKAADRRVSVVLATYNGEDFLGDQLQSLLVQTRPIDEIILTDDASVDATLAMLREFRDAFPKSCVLLSNDHRVGVTKNFERGLERATSDLILLSDQDDVWLPDKVARFVAAFEEDSSVTAVYCDAWLSVPGSRARPKTLWQSIRLGASERERLRRGDISDVLMKRTLAFGNVMGVRSDVVAGSLPFPDDWPHDGFLSWVATIRGSASIIEEPLVSYRQHAGQQSGGVLGRGSARDPGSTACPALWVELAARLSALDPPDERRTEQDRVIQQVRSKASHLERRAKIRSGNRLGRVFPVLAEARAGGYQTYSNGVSSMALDLLTNGSAPEDRTAMIDRSRASPAGSEWRMVYRYSEGRNRKGRPDYFSKALALASFVRSIRATSPMPPVVFVIDGSVDEPIRQVMESVGTTVHIDRGSNSRSYLDALDIATAQGTTWVYLSEDDYLYREEAFPRLFEACAVLANPMYLTLYDHPDRYRDGDNGASGQVRFAGGHHWRSVGSTCMSFAAARSALRRDVWVHRACSQKPSPMDYLMWRVLVNPKGLRGLLRRRTLFSPIPSLATHLEAEHLAPGIDWSSEANIVRAWAQAEYGLDA